MSASLMHHLPVHCNGDQMQDGRRAAHHIDGSPHVADFGAHYPIIAYLETNRIVKLSNFVGG